MCCSAALFSAQITDALQVLGPRGYREQAVGHTIFVQITLMFGAATFPPGPAVNPGARGRVGGGSTPLTTTPTQWTPGCIGGIGLGVAAKVHTWPRNADDRARRRGRSQRIVGGVVAGDREAGDGDRSAGADIGGVMSAGGGRVQGDEIPVQLAGQHVVTGRLVGCGGAVDLGDAALQPSGQRGRGAIRDPRRAGIGAYKGCRPSRPWPCWYTELPVTSALVGSQPRAGFGFLCFSLTLII
jgi:hypothetical protein